MRWYRQLATAGVAIATLATLAACDGGPAFYAKVNLVNDCSSTIWAEVTNESVTDDRAEVDQEVFMVDRGKSISFETSVLRPVGDNLRLWTAASPDEGFHSSTLVPVTDTEQYTDDEGYEVYVLHITGDLCPG